MKTAADIDAIVWLKDFMEPPPHDFDWNHGNLTKNAKHGVEPDDIESLFLDPFWYFAGKIVTPHGSEWRGLILARDRRGRELALIFTRRGRALRPISCRRMRDEEKEIYRENGPGRTPRSYH